MCHLNWGNALWLKEQHQKWVGRKPILFVEDVGSMLFIYKKECAPPADLEILQSLDVITGQEIKADIFKFVFDSSKN